LFVSDFDIPPDQDIEEFAVVPNGLEVKVEEAFSGLDDDSGLSALELK
jgi:hypothetical protein